MSATSRAFQPRLSPDTEAFQAFLVGAKSLWGTHLFREVAGEAARLGLEAPAAIEQAMAGSVAYQYFAWLEHYLQQFKFLGPYGIIEAFATQGRAISRAFDEAMTRGPGSIRLDPRLELPGYYREGDFHQHPGGIWSDDSDAFVYEWGARLGAFSVLLSDADDLHSRLARLIASGSPSAVLDLGCGFGKSTLPIKRQAAKARVAGVDLSAPVLHPAVPGGTGPLPANA
jgi:hypothetical protein